MVRKSARARKVISYTTDAYKGLDSDGEPPPAPPDSSSDEDFQAGAGGDDPAEDSDSEPSSPRGRYEDEDGSDDSLDEEEEDSYDDSDGGRARKKRTRTPKTSRTTAPSTPAGGPRPTGSAPVVHKKHVRTVANGLTGRGRRKTRLLAEGAAPNVIRAPDPTVRITYRPGFQKATGKMERITQVYGDEPQGVEMAMCVKEMYIATPAVPERAGLHPSPFWKEGETVELGTGNGGQRMEPLGLEETMEFMGPEGEPLKAVVGPIGKYQRAVFKRFGVFPLRKYAPEKKGYIFNVGGQPLSMEWATNRPDGDQFLAVSLMNLPDIAKENNPDTSEDPPAFSSRPSKSTIQIWRFPVPEEGTPSPVVEPSVVMMLCHEWGPARTMKWCPARMRFEDPKVLGYLAAVFGDGTVRVLKIALPDSYDAESCDFSVHFTTPLYTCILPDEILTTVSWISPTALVAGSANGMVGCWSLIPSHPNPVPYHTISVHQTYITGLTTCFPSFPHHIVTSSMDGCSRITSLSCTDPDSVPNNRSRIAPACIAYVDAIQSGVSVEEGTWVKFFPARRYFSSTTTCKHNGVVRSLASSLLHTSILSGGTEGEAVFSNPARRVFHGKIRNYTQTWFGVEFAETLGAGSPAHGGLMRITEGFALEECEEKAKTKGGQQLLTTVFPQQVCVEAVCWNPNLRYGGWAAAAMSCGLVRVEDVALD